MIFQASREEEIKERKISKYNSALAQNFRLDKLWTACNILSCAGRLMDWNWKLDAVWRELYPDAAKTERKKILEINKTIFKCKEPTKLYAKLNYKEMFLRLVENREGKGTAYQNPEEDEMD